MGASGRKARVRTVGVLWKDIDCVVVMLYRALCSYEVAEMVVRYLTTCVPWGGGGICSTHISVTYRQGVHNTVDIYQVLEYLRK